MLGGLYDFGKGVAQDYAEAVTWYRLAAAQGFASAQSLLGSMSQFNLGNMYLLGHSVPQDYVLAHLWFNLAAARGDKDAAKNRDIVEELMTPDQIAEAQRVAREWKPTPAQ
jgi:TPR repeat protein